MDLSSEMKMDMQSHLCMNLSLRSDYVPGATHSPVAYVEGIYVRDEYRKQGIGAALIKSAQEWAIDRGCIELASDALIGNSASQEFHTKIGFQEVERTVFFIKPIVASDLEYKSVTTDL
jgi:aminoglycoside 6'-N-acetyltransferase I